jgi:beta-lactam-binding protein with PASTA domain/serine/threonine protein kinase
MEPHNNAEVCPNCGYREGGAEPEGVQLPLGSELRGRYITGMTLGSGAFGITYVAWDKQAGQKVAVKEYLPGEFATRLPGTSEVTVFSDAKKQKQFHDGLVKFLGEGEKLRGLPGDGGIARVLDCFGYNNTAYLVTEYLNGETLEKRLAKTGFSAAEAIELTLPLIHSLELAHGAGIVHCNICPKNIILTTDGRMKLIDFAAARFATTSHSRSLTAVVSVGYSPEEQYRSLGDTGAYTDIYALSAVLYRMITGIAPPDALERRAALALKKRDIISPIPRGAATRSQTAAIMNGLNIRIEDRTPDAATLASELTAKAVKQRANRIRGLDFGTLPRAVKIAAPLVLFVIAAAIALFAGGIIRFDGNVIRDIAIPEGMTRVPSVISRDVDEAAEILVNAELQYSIVDKRYSSTVPADYILLQNIEAGRVVDTNTTVALTISGGREMKLVPLVEGDDIALATETLELLGFIVKAEKSPSLYKSEGIVFSQDIPANSEYAVGETVTLKISNGEIISGVAYLETVPDLTGLSLTQATEKLMSLAGSGKNDGKPFGIDENSVKEYSKTVPEGHIISQNLKAGTSEMTDKTFRFTLSMGLHYEKVPDVQYKSAEEAGALLTNAGFTFVKREINDERVAGGHIISQEPAANTTVEYGTAVSLLVSLGKRQFPVPRVTGLDIKEAKSVLTSAGLTVSVVETRDDNAPLNSVISQNPPKDAMAVLGDNVELTVCAGKIRRIVPNVVGTLQTDAKKKFDDLNLKLKISETYDNTVAKGTVISQNTAPGTELESGAEIEIVVSLGKKPVTVPKLSEQTASAAERTLNALNLKFVYSAEEFDENIPRGTVKSQSPAANSQAFEGDTITLVLSKGPAPVSVPDVRSTAEAAARRTLEGKGFIVSVTYEDSASVPIGEVISQNPAAGANAERNSRVAISVSRGIAVANVVGCDESYALSALSAQQLTAKTVYQESTLIAKGSVISQSPTAQSYVNKNAIVTLTVSSGTRVPSLTGLDQSVAITALRAAGLNASVIRETSAAVRLDIVISQNITAGTFISAGDTVTINVSDGITVPNVTGESRAAAEAKIKGAGLRVSVSEQESVNVPKGQVISQSPLYGAKANANDTVAIIVSGGVIVPNVTGQTRSNAEAALQAKGLRVSVNEIQSDSIPAGQVITQNPMAGTTVDIAATITITVSGGDGKVEVPNVVSNSQADAEYALTSQGLRVEILEEYSEIFTEGTVISQSPQSGRVAPGTLITITISLGIEPPPEQPPELEEQPPDT